VTTVGDMLADVRAALPAAVAVNFTVATAPWDLFEAYVFSQVVVAARSDGYVITYVRLQPGPPPQFVFRRGFGSIWSTRFSFVKAMYAPASGLEVHVGVRVEGQSGVAHEADVSVLLGTEAAVARRERFAPRARGCILAFECKYYFSGLDLSILREYLGLTTDLRSHHVHQWLVSNVSHPELPTLMKHHNRFWADDVLPGSRGEHNLRQQIEPALNRFRR
jgi:hypothetical protein